MKTTIKLPSNFYDYSYIEMMKTEKNIQNRDRLLAMAHIKDGETIKFAANAVKVHWKTVQRWLKGFRENGIEGLLVKVRPGAPKKLNDAAESWLNDFIHALAEDKTCGMITGTQLHKMIADQFSISCCLRTIYNTLHRLKFSWITSRSIHPKADLEAQSLYKKLSNSLEGVSS